MEARAQAQRPRAGRLRGPWWARRPLNLAKVVPQTVRSVVNLVQTRRNSDGPGMATPLTAPRTIFNHAITGRRSVAYTAVSLDDVKTIKKAFGTTVNDVVLTVAAERCAVTSSSTTRASPTSR